MKKSSYENIKDQLEERILSYATDNDRLFIRQSVISLFKLKDSKRLETFIEKVERIKYTTEKNKTFIMLYGIVLLETRKAFSASLSDDALILFIYYYRDYEFMDRDINSCHSKVLETVCEKTNSLEKREKYYSIAMHLLEENRNVDILEKIKNMDEDEYKKLFEKYDNGEALQQMVNESKNKELGHRLRKAGLL